MQVIIVDHRRGWTRRFDASGSRARAFAVASGLALSVVFAAVLVAGWHLHSWFAPQRVEVVDVWGPDVADQRAEINELRERLHDESAAFARRIATLQAHMTRLDAAGERMTRLADLDEGEFNFQSAPALGGPASEYGETPVLSELTAELDALEARIRSRSRQLSVLEEMLVASRVRDESRPEGRPVTAGYISSQFGRRIDPFTGRAASHYGIDFAAVTGTEVAAVGSGIVEYSGPRSGYGKMVEINHGNGYTTRYGHNSKLMVRVGERVTRGQAIAEVGASGRATGPHLHFEVRYNGKAVNPARFVSAAR